MSRTCSQTPRLTVDRIYSPHVQAVLYDILLVATPLVMVRSFMQQFALELTKYTFTVSGLELPTVPTIVFSAVAILLIFIRRHITWRRVLAALIAVAMVALAQRINDFYSNHKFYDLQQNWHYIAYVLFSCMIYRDHVSRGLPVAKMIVTAWIIGFSLSTFDELFQLFMSSRVFDPGDVAKDAWGVVMGLVILFVGGDKWELLRADMKNLHHSRLRDYWAHPFTALLLLAVLTFIFLNVSSLMTDAEHLLAIALITIGLFLLFYLLLHLSRIPALRYGIIGLLLLTAMGQAYLCATSDPEQISYNRYGLTVYRGFVIPFFDVMIYPDGKFRLVDKKHNFNVRDRLFFMKEGGADITLIGGGAYQKGGNGYSRKTPSQFVYNTFKKRGNQVIILSTPDACRVFNRLKKEGRNVLFVLHNTC